MRKEANPNLPDDRPCNYFLSVLFPGNQMMILDYKRVVTDLSGMDVAAFMVKLKENFTASEANTPVKPVAESEFGIYLGGKWYKLTVNDDLVPAETWPASPM